MSTKARFGPKHWLHLLFGTMAALLIFYGINVAGDSIGRQSDARVHAAQLQHDTAVQAAAAEACKASSNVDDCVAGAVGNNAAIKIRACGKSADVQKCILEVTGQLTVEQQLEQDQKNREAAIQATQQRIAACQALYDPPSNKETVAQCLYHQGLG